LAFIDALEPFQEMIGFFDQVMVHISEKIPSHLEPGMLSTSFHLRELDQVGFETAGLAHFQRVMAGWTVTLRRHPCGNEIFENLDAGHHSSHVLAYDIRDMVMVEINPMRVHGHTFPGLNHSAGDANDGSVWVHIPDDHRIGAYAHVVAQGNGAKDLGSGANQDTIAQGGMALALVPTGASQRDSVVKRDIVADFRRLANNHSCSMIDEEATADGCSGMNVDIAPKPGEKSQQARQVMKSATPQAVAQTVHENGMHAGVSGQYFKTGAGRRIALKNTGHILPPFRE
jgi:hypothetical protein